MIISGGENVFPREVEDIFYKHSAVLEAAIIGIPYPCWVEKIHTVIVLREGVVAIDKKIITFCKKQPVGYKAPKSVEFVYSQPKNSKERFTEKALNKYKYNRPLILWIMTHLS